jgi:hypothetical protein
MASPSPAPTPGFWRSPARCEATARPTGHLQALEIGAPVRKGAKAAPAILYKQRVIGEDASDGPESESETKIARYMKTYAVFNAADLTDCPEIYLAAPKVDAEVRAAARNAILDAVPAKIELGGSRAFYSPQGESACRRRRRLRPRITSWGRKPTSLAIGPAPPIVSTGSSASASVMKRIPSRSSWLR